MGLLLVRMINPNATRDDLGLIPFWIDPDNPKSARDQLDDEYQHGGGWRPFKGHALLPDDSLAYPDDPPLKPLAEIRLRQERVLVYEYGWVAIIQPDRSFEVCRMD